MTASEAIAKLNELDPNEHLAIAWFRQPFFSASTKQWHMATRFADTTPWTCFAKEIDNYLVTLKRKN